MSAREWNPGMMSTRDDRGVPISSGVPAILLAVAVGLPSACFFGLFGSVGAGLGGSSSVLTLPKMALLGASLGAGAGGLIALLCGCRLRSGFCCVFLAALAAVGYMFFVPDTRADPHQLRNDNGFLGVVFLGILAGAVVRQFVRRFGAESRAWAGISAGVCLPLGAVLQYFYGEQLDLTHNPEYVAFLLVGALIGALVGGCVGAMAGAIRDSA